MRGGARARVPRRGRRLGRRARRTRARARPSRSSPSRAGCSPAPRWATWSRRSPRSSSAPAWSTGSAGRWRRPSELARRLAAELAPEVPEPDNVAKRLARRLYGRVALIYGAALAAPAARRWKAQINENANAAAFFAELPELNHNEFSGWTADPAVSSSLHVVLLEDRLAARTAASPRGADARARVRLRRRRRRRREQGRVSAGAPPLALDRRRPHLALPRAAVRHRSGRHRGHHLAQTAHGRRGAAAAVAGRLVSRRLGVSPTSPAASQRGPDARGARSRCSSSPRSSRTRPIAAALAAGSEPVTLTQQGPASGKAVRGPAVRGARCRGRRRPRARRGTSGEPGRAARRTPRDSSPAVGAAPVRLLVPAVWLADRPVPRRLRRRRPREPASARRAHRPLAGRRAALLPRPERRLQT